MGQMTGAARQITLPSIKSNGKTATVFYSADLRRAGNSIFNNFSLDHINELKTIEAVASEIRQIQKDNAVQCELWIETALIETTNPSLLVDSVVAWVVHGDGTKISRPNDQFNRFRTLALEVLALNLDPLANVAQPGVSLVYAAHSHAALAAVLAKAGRQGLKISSISPADVELLKNIVGKQDNNFRIDWAGAQKVIAAYEKVQKK